MYFDEIKKFFEKLQLFPTLDAISILLQYTNDKSIISAFNIVAKKNMNKNIQSLKELMNMIMYAKY